MSTFLEYPRFPDVVAGLAHGGPTYSTAVISLKSGFEQRNQNWSLGRGVWEFPESMEQIKNAPTLISFFRVVKGRAMGFRFRDPLDYGTTQIQGALARISSNVYQLFKTYSYGGMIDARKITKPDSTGFICYKNGVTYAVTLDATTGKITTPAVLTATITGISKANPGVVTTAAAHGLVTGQKVDLSGIFGMLEANLQDVQIIVLSPTTFSFGVNTTAFTTYGSGGVVLLYPQTQDTTVSLAISSVTGAATKTITTSTPHGLVSGATVTLSGIVGLTNVSGDFVVTVTGVSTFTVLTALSIGAYVSGGAVAYILPAADTLAWSGVFDVPCRFDHDDLKIGYNSGGLLDWSGVKIVEVLA